jgi:hypothetical protein
MTKASKMTKANKRNLRDALATWLWLHHGWEEGPCNVVADLLIQKQKSGFIRIEIKK